MTIVEMSVHMDCAGCEKKIRKAIQRMEGVDDVEIDMERQKVTVNGNVEQKKVLKAVRRTGRRAVLWPHPYTAGATAGVLAQQQQHYHPGGGQAHAAHAARPTSSYNYYKHGYDDSLLYGANSAVVGSRATDYFSDENPQSCSVM
ncbi:heavy metal-associated isoprenylated plant protein 28 [Oryza brachyantha]|uniref:heavy metal-associated isoprenylated plant protein 28 n=1 Tax=Oryza brachyantha TaxID=4533 RepID=UPI0007760DEA|nr:heavy metal-associated isoprenylated plant protein 28 [Oryza brachyantha]